MPAPAPSSHLPMVLEIVVLTLLLATWTTLVWRTRGRILRGLTDLAVQSTRGIASRRLRRISLKRFAQLARVTTRLTSLGLVLLGLFIWALLLMGSLPSTHDLASRLEHELYLELGELAGAAAAALPNLFVVALIYFLARVAHEMLGHYFLSISEGEVESSLFDPITADTTRRLADIGIWVVAIIVAFPYLPGSHSAAFRGVSVLVGLMLSLGSANLVAQFTHGLSLIYGRAIRPGDYIETERGEGVIEHIGLLACNLRTPRDEQLSLPHSVVAAGLKNFSRGRSGVRYVTEVTIGYDAPWRQVRELLLAAAADTPGVRDDPAPVVRQAALEDFYVRYELQFTPAHPADRVPLLGRLHEAIQDRFHGAGLQIMSPHYRGDPPTPKIPPAATTPSGGIDTPRPLA